MQSNNAFMIRGFAVVALTLISGHSQAKSGRDFDFDKINANLAAAMNEVVGDRTNVTELKSQIEARGTNLTQDKFHETMSLRLAKTPWSNEPVEVTKSVKVKIKKHQNKEIGYLVQDVDTSLTSDPLAFFKYLTQSKRASCGPAAKVSGLDKILAGQACAAAPDVEAAADLKALTAAFRKSLTQTTETLTTFSTSARADIDHAQNQALKEEGLKLLARVDAILKTLISVQIIDTDQGFTMSYGSFHCPDTDIKIKDFKVEGAGTRITTNLKIRLPLNLAIYSAVEPEVEPLLRGLEQGSEHSMEHARASARVLIRLVEKFQAGELSPAAMHGMSFDKKGVAALVAKMLVLSAT